MQLGQVLLGRPGQCAASGGQHLLASLLDLGEGHLTLGEIDPGKRAGDAGEKVGDPQHAQGTQIDLPPAGAGKGEQDDQVEEHQRMDKTTQQRRPGTGPVCGSRPQACKEFEGKEGQAPPFEPEQLDGDFWLRPPLLQALDDGVEQDQDAQESRQDAAAKVAGGGDHEKLEQAVGQA